MNEPTPLALLLAAWCRESGAGPPECLHADLFDELPPPLELAGLRAPSESIEDGRGRAERRRGGVYYTPPAVVEHVLELELDGLPAGARWCDPTCGSGHFLHATARRGVPLDRLYGLDVDPVAVLACRLGLVALGLPPEQAARQIRLGDGLVSDPPGAPFDVVVGNPPWGLSYTASERRRIAAALTEAPGLGRGELCSAALFCVRSTQLLRPGGRASLVLPESWLSSRRGEPLRRWLLTQVRLRSLSVLRKGVFPAAPDMLPVVASWTAEQPSGRGVTLRKYGLRRPWRADGPVTWEQTSVVEPASWLEEPLAVFATGTDPELAGLWRRLAAWPRLADFATIHDGVYKSHLVPLLGDGPVPVLLRAAEVTRYRIEPGTACLSRAALAALPAGEQARQGRPKVLCHAMRKPALADRIVAAVDEQGRYVVSNNLVLVLPHPESGWSLAAVAALLNSRLLNRWFADRFMQVNIEAFALGSLPVPPQPSPRLTTLARAALAGDAVDPLVEAELDRLYGLSGAERQAVERRWRGLP